MVLQDHPIGLPPEDATSTWNGSWPSETPPEAVELGTEQGISLPWVLLTLAAWSGGWLCGAGTVLLGVLYAGRGLLERLCLGG